MNLLDCRKDVFSSTGNDGIIEKIMSVLGIKRSQFIEFGAWDGLTGSNCRYLYQKGWTGVFIECDENKYKKLRENYNTGGVVCIKAKIDAENTLDELLFKHKLGLVEYDFVSVDIDGLDLEVFEDIEHFLPTVVCIEGGQMLEPYYQRVTEEVSSRNIQQSLKVMNDVFESKGYKILCAYQDAFFVKKEHYDKFDVSTDLKDLYLDGLQALPHRLPYIQKQLKKVGIRNAIVEFVLNRANYKKYGWDKRKKWAVKELPEITKAIRELR